ncbi:MAG TPA: AraC family transcriptional regulator [Allosphingosinicella sp.]|nr:AraC family transcriptional regulator [Allosphingosinicella sp.]
MSASPVLRHAATPAGPLEEMSRILDRPPLALSEGLRGDTLLTGRWTHGAVHASLPAMPAHVIIAHHGGDAEIALRGGDGTKLRSTTRQGTIVIIPKGHDGRWDIAGEVDVSHVYLTQDRLQASAEALTGGRPVELLDRVGFEDPAITRILGLLCDEANAGDPSARLFLEQALDLLCTQLVRGHSSFGALAAPTPRRGLAEWQLKKVTAYMRAMLDQEIGLNELAALVNLSRFHFCTAFRLATGRTPHEWLTALRIGRAKDMLADPLLPVTEIALCVGYQTPSSFAASFRKVTGTTPSAFRRGL